MVYDASLDATSVSLLFVVRGTEDYGTGTKVLGLLESLMTRGAAVCLYILGEGIMVGRARAYPLLPIIVDPAVPERFEVNQSNRRIMAFTRTLRESTTFMAHLGQYLRRNRYHAIVFCEHGLVLQLGAVARMVGIQAFWIMANAVSATYPLDLNRRIYAFAFRYLAVVPVANSEYTRRTLGRGARHASKIDLGINPDRIAAQQVVVPLPERAGGRIRVLVMSRLVHGKGHLVLLKAILSQAAFKDIELVIGGGPVGTPYANMLTQEAAMHGAENRLHLLGPVSDVARHYRMADVVVSARLDPEPFGLSIVEAMLAGKPVLAHASGGPADIVVDGVTGWHVAAPTIDAFAAGLLRMLDDRPRWLEMGRAAHARALQNYTHHSMTNQLLAVIGERLLHP